MRLFLAATLAFTAVLFLGISSRAEEPKKDPPKAPVKETPKDGDNEAAKADEVDICKIPENPTSDQLVAFAKTLLKYSPKTREESATFQAKARPAVQKACEMIARLEKTDKTENGHFAGL